MGNYGLPWYEAWRVAFYYPTWRSSAERDQFARWYANRTYSRSPLDVQNMYGDWLFQKEDWL